MEFSKLNIVVVGLGRTGISVARFLAAKGARVTATDLAGENGLDPAVKQLRKQGVKLALGGHSEAAFLAADLIVVSPGVPHTITAIEKAAAKNITVWGEIELASRLIEEPIIAVTGTNGKTTTTRLIGCMMARSGIRAFVGGNIGTPLIDYLDQKEKAQIVVAEVSSFQLDTIDGFRPAVGILLNISADHLDRYDDFKAYRAAKGRIFSNQTPSDTAVYNGTDPNVEAVVKHVRSEPLPFFSNASAARRIKQGAVIEGDALHFYRNRRKEETIDLSGLKLPGIHNRENAAAAGLAAWTMGISPAGISAAVAGFQGIAHRLEYVAEIDGVTYYNDSKATNTAAVVRALEGFSQPVILILGGRDKTGDFSALRRPVSARVKKVIALGEAAAAIAESLSPVASLSTAGTMSRAVADAHRSARRGDVVLLSPACASFDMYTGYDQRGDAFKDCVLGLKQETRANTD